MSFTNEELVKVAAREFAMRRSAYPKFVARGTMKQDEADYQLAAMEAIIVEIKRVPELEAKVKSLQAFKDGVDEALNMGDGAYRP